jgi:hypothetical protein
MWNLSLWYIAMLLKPDKDKEGGGAYPKKSYWQSGPTRRSLQKFNSQTTTPNTQNKIDHQQVCEK